MNKFRSIFCVLLSVFILFLCSCSLEDFIPKEEKPENDETETETDTTEEKSFFTVARYTGEELDVYKSSGRTNRDLLSLCYNGLIYVSENLTAVPDLCERYEIDGRRVDFYINPESRFSDGTQVKASDCVYSYAKAETFGSVYKNRFDIIIGYEATDEFVFTVWFSTDNISNVNLADIPIIKGGSDKSYFPVGAGDYYIIKDLAEIYLMKSNPEDKIENILVYDVDDAEELLYAINYGKISASYADLSSGASSFRSGVELIDFTTDNFIFAVVNRNKEYFADVDAVKGITYAIQRSEIISRLLSPSSKAVWYPFNPDWQRTVESELNEDIYSTQTANELFNSAGITLSGTVRVYNKMPVELVIVVNQENLIKVNVAERVAKDLTEMGFTATVNALKWDEMTAVITNGEYDIFIGEINLFSNMELNSILSNELYLTSLTEEGLSLDFLSAYDDFYAGYTDMRTFLSAFQNEMPFIPLYFSGGALAVNRRVSTDGGFSASVYSIYGNIAQWEYK